MSTLPIGTYLQEKKYKIEAVLGQGGFGITYLATQEITHERIAIKEFFFKEYCERDESTHLVTVPTAGNRDVVKQFEKKFLKEARMIRQLHHEHIVRVFDVFQENCTSYYAMEYINGRPLSDYIASKGRLAEDEALPIIETVGSALSYLHSQSINHLDIKPANIMLDRADKRVVLIDFGVSKQYDPQSGEGTTTTPVGVSNGYSPLEQYNPGGVSSFSPQSDIYALAATLLKMLTGQTPPSAIDVSQKGINIPDSVSPNIAQAISLAMQSVKDERPSSIASFLDIIHHGAEGETNITHLHNNPTSKNKKHSWLWLSLLIALIAGITLFFVLNGSHNKNRDSYDEDEETAYIDEDEDELYAEAIEEEEEEKEDELEMKHYSKTITVNGVSFKMVRVEGGTFTMGATAEQGSNDEQPLHRVTLSTFSIGETEVTQQLWEAVMGSNPSYFKGAQRPVEQVSWEDCQGFIRELNRLTGRQFRLPTEAEWEFAARGGNKSSGCKYAGSNGISNVAWYIDNSSSTTHDVKTKLANELGLYDMSGNVWEWCQDWYGSYSSATATNPTGPSSGSRRVDRGGSWHSSAWRCRVSRRSHYAPSDQGYNLGLRLAL